MDRAGIRDEVHLHLRLLHLRLECGDFVRLYEWVVRAVTDEHLRLHAAFRRGYRGAEPAVEAHDAGERRAAAGQLQHRRAAEAVADRRGLRRVDAGPLQELIETERHAAAQERQVLLVSAGLHRAFLRVRRAHALAVDVGGEGDVAEFGELLRARLGVILEARPIMDHEHAGARRVERIVVGDEAFERGVTVFVFDGLRLDLRECGVGEKGERSECERRFHALNLRPREWRRQALRPPR